MLLDGLIYFLLGLAVIIFISTIGAVGSRKLDFKYSYLGVISVLLYIGLGFLISKQEGILHVLIINGILGLLDSTLGYNLSISFKANNGYAKQESLKMIGLKTSIGMILFTVALGLVGYVVGLMV